MINFKRNILVGLIMAILVLPPTHGIIENKKSL